MQHMMNEEIHRFNEFVLLKGPEVGLSRQPPFPEYASAIPGPPAPGSGVNSPQYLHRATATFTYNMHLPICIAR